MNKPLLLLLAAACAGQASGAVKAPTIYENASFKDISADGRYILSDILGTVAIYDLQQGTQTVFGSDEEWHSLGLGHCVSADGSIIVGSTSQNTNASYYDGGKWTLLNVPSPEKSNLANAVTPDGSRICGSIGVNEMTIDEDVLMQAPVYWDRLADGTYGDAVRLPHPDTDFFGSTPQYITAINISDDGKVIAGQVVDCRGMMVVPILYTQADNGEWSYSFPTRHLFNPAGIPAVKNPGEAERAPSEKEFMTDEERTAWEAAYQAYIASGYSTEFPEYADYMTDEEQAAFQAAYKTWQDYYHIWEEEYNAFSEYYFNVVNASPDFVFNNICLSADGKTIATSAETIVEDPTAWMGRSAMYIPWTIDAASGEVVKYELGKSIIANGITADGTVLGGSVIGSIPMIGYFLRDGQATTLTEYLATISPEYDAWLKSNMTHEVAVDYEFDEDLQDWVEVYKEQTFTGIMVATPDLSVIGFWNDCPWDYSAYAVGVVVDLTQFAGITGTETDDAGATDLDADGNLRVASGTVSVSVYNLSGALVAYAENPAGTVALDLADGVYVVRTVAADGTSEVAKIAK